MAVGVIYFWSDERLAEDGLYWLEIARRHLDGMRPSLQAQVLHAIGGIFEELARLDESRICLSQSVALFERQDSSSRRDWAIACNDLAIAMQYAKKYEEAQRLYELALAAYQELGMHQREGQTVRNLGVLYLSRGELELAQNFLSKALRAGMKLGNAKMECLSLMWLADCMFAQGSHKEALNTSERALAIGATLGDELIRANILQRQAKIAATLGDLELARRSLLEALTVASYQKNPAGIAESIECAAAIAISAKRHSLGARLIGLASTFRRGKQLPRSKTRESYLGDLGEIVKVALGKAGYESEVEAGQSIAMDSAVVAIREAIHP
jgi:tetratricopeptide (TPR) repeat protein